MYAILPHLNCDIFYHDIFSYHSPNLVSPLSPWMAPTQRYCGLLSLCGVSNCQSYMYFVWNLRDHWVLKSTVGYRL